MAQPLISDFAGRVTSCTEVKRGSRMGWLSEAAQAVIARQPRTESTFVLPSPMALTGLVASLETHYGVLESSEDGQTNSSSERLWAIG